ncbi:dynein axonemal heavy chain 10-like isoform X4 [Conger conger]|uniref:dynein axonemal heavy chain 10-like isoform X4 n=1 Tax=Conger conger TaxID=82655 RepID=UPI002A59F12D|nr:dynein axonemal heavy chain 10-like isoform X4 [Conger conger]
MRRFLRFCFSSVLGKKRLNMKYLLEQPELDRLFEKYVPKCIDTIVDGVVDGKQEKLKTIVPQTDLNMELLENNRPGHNAHGGKDSL